MNNDPRNYFYNQRNTTTQDTTTSQKTTSATTGDKAIDEKVKQMQALAKKYEKAGESQLIKDLENMVYGIRLPILQSLKEKRKIWWQTGPGSAPPYLSSLPMSAFPGSVCQCNSKDFYFFTVYTIAF